MYREATNDKQYFNSDTRKLAQGNQISSAADWNPYGVYGMRKSAGETAGHDPRVLRFQQDLAFCDAGDGGQLPFLCSGPAGVRLSDKPEQRVYTITEHAFDIAAWMERLELGKVLLIGHSMGSIVAQTVAAFYPERVCGLALLSTFCHMHETPEQVREVREFYDGLDIQHTSDDELQKMFVPDPSKLADASFLPGYLSTLRGIRGRGLTAAWFGMSLADNRNFLQFIKAPVLICWGSQDDIFTKEYQDEMLCVSAGSRV